VIENETDNDYRNDRGGCHYFPHYLLSVSLAKVGYDEPETAEMRIKNVYTDCVERMV